MIALGDFKFPSLKGFNLAIDFSQEDIFYFTWEFPSLKGFNLAIDWPASHGSACKLLCFHPSKGSTSL